MLAHSSALCGLPVCHNGERFLQASQAVVVEKPWSRKQGIEQLRQCMVKLYPSADGGFNNGCSKKMRQKMAAIIVMTITVNGFNLVGLRNAVWCYLSSKDGHKNINILYLPRLDPQSIFFDFN